MAPQARVLLSSIVCVVATSVADARSQAPYQIAAQRKVHLMWRNSGGMSFLGGARAMAVGDLDNDGAPDLAASGGANFEYVRLNDGAGRFVDGRFVYLTFNVPVTAGVVQLGDVDRDGLPDIFIGDVPTPLHSGRNRLFLNRGSGTFSEVTTTHLPADTDATVGAAFSDIDGDGDLDLVLANGNLAAQQDRVYANDGKGVFRDVTATSLPGLLDPSTAVVAGDLDGDGDQDLVIGTASGTATKLLLNTGNGRFSAAPFNHLLAELVNDLDLVDVEADGDLDVVAAVGRLLPPNTGPKQSRLLLNDGKAGFTDVTAAQLPGVVGDCTGVGHGDVDRDGDHDLVFVVKTVARLYLNDGRGTYADASAQRLPAERWLTGSWDPARHRDSVVLVDLDRDGDLDIAGIDGHLLNDGRGTFAHASKVSSLTERPNAIDSINQCGSIVVDVDRDGDLDVVMTGRNQVTGVSGGLFLNDGRGRFRDASATHLPATGTGWFWPAAADVDGDGDLDLAFGGQPGPLLLQNNGTGVFTDISSTLPFQGGDIRGVTFADVDRDGDADLILANHPTSAQTGQDRLLVNDGRGRFTDVTASQMPADTDHSNSCAAIDVDKDGDLDLVFANGSGLWPPGGIQNRLYRNDGSGRFTDVTTTALPAEKNNSNQIAAADIDGDGDVDFASNDSSLMLPGQIRLYLNGGAGAFAAATGRLPAGSYSSDAVFFADFDEDGDADLYVSAGPRGTHDVLVNDGKGFFASAGRAEFGSFAAAADDLDGDGDIDIVSGTHLLVNRHRHVHSPYVAQAGRPFVIDVYGKPGYAPGTEFAVPLLGFNLFPRPMQIPGIGRLWISPVSMVLGAPLLLPSVGGQTSLSFTLPSIPSLVGQTMAWQAVILEGGRTWRLTNVETDMLGF